MTAPTETRLSGECQAAKRDPEMHKFCTGNIDVFAYGAPRGEQPVVKYRCGCDHHKEPGARP